MSEQTAGIVIVFLVFSLIPVVDMISNLCHCDSFLSRHKKIRNKLAASGESGEETEIKQISSRDAFLNFLLGEESEEAKSYDSRPQKLTFTESIIASILRQDLRKSSKGNEDQNDLEDDFGDDWDDEIW